MKNKKLRQPFNVKFAFHEFNDYLVLNYLCTECCAKIYRNLFFKNASNVCEKSSEMVLDVVAQN